MHELAVTMEVVDVISDQLEEYSTLQVKRVVLEIGALASVIPDSVRFCFDLCTQGTPLEGALLEILETQGEGLCRKCRTVIQTQDRFAVCRCGSMDFDWTKGQELIIKEVEFESR